MTMNYGHVCGRIKTMAKVGKLLRARAPTRFSVAT